MLTFAKTLAAAGYGGNHTNVGDAFEWERIPCPDDEAAYFF
jgi:hypothetical protein